MPHQHFHSSEVIKNKPYSDERVHLILIHRLVAFCLWQLLNGDYGSFVAGRYQPTELPASYREQLIVNARMFIEQQEKEHKGIKSVSVAGGVADTTRHMADAFLIFTYGDGTKEQVVVPMVSVKNVWYMR